MHIVVPTQLLQTLEIFQTNMISYYLFQKLLTNIDFKSPNYIANVDGTTITMLMYECHITLIQYRYIGKSNVTI